MFLNGSPRQAKSTVSDLRRASRTLRAANRDATERYDRSSISQASKSGNYLDPPALGPRSHVLFPEQLTALESATYLSLTFIPKKLRNEPISMATSLSDAPCSRTHLPGIAYSNVAHLSHRAWLRLGYSTPTGADTMAVTMYCPSLCCPAILRVSEDRRGKLIECAECGTIFRVPFQPAASPAPPQAVVEQAACIPHAPVPDRPPAPQPAAKPTVEAAARLPLDFPLKRRPFGPY